MFLTDSECIAQICQNYSWPLSCVSYDEEYKLLSRKEFLFHDSKASHCCKTGYARNLSVCGLCLKMNWNNNWRCWNGDGSLCVMQGHE